MPEDWYIVERDTYEDSFDPKLSLETQIYYRSLWTALSFRSDLDEPEMLKVLEMTMKDIKGDKKLVFSLIVNSNFYPQNGLMDVE